MFPFRGKISYCSEPPVSNDKSIEDTELTFDTSVNPNTNSQPMITNVTDQEMVADGEDVDMDQ